MMIVTMPTYGKNLQNMQEDIAASTRSVRETKAMRTGKGLAHNVVSVTDMHFPANGYRLHTEPFKDIHFRCLCHLLLALIHAPLIMVKQKRSNMP